MDDSVGDAQSKYRISEFYNALKNIIQLDNKLRDDKNVLIPIKIPKLHVAQCCNDAHNIKFSEFDQPDLFVAQLMFAVSEIFTLISQREENIYSPFEIEQANTKILLKRYLDYFQKIFQPEKIGLSLEVSNGEAKRGAISLKDKTNYHIIFIRPYPLYVYVQLAEAAATGEWEERR